MSGADSRRDTVRQLIDRHGTTYAAEAGIRLRDKPAPLYQLLVLTTLSSTRISADVAVAATRELLRCGWRTPRRMRESTWQERVDALGRGGYRRYDESTATQLDKGAAHLLHTWGGDLRRLREDTTGVEALLGRVADFPRIGPTGAGIFCREVQVVWPDVAPFFDGRALASARRRGLPADPGELADLAGPGRVARLAVALVRADLG